MTKKKLITGIVAGVAIGGVLGYLFATEKGAKTRQKIADQTGSFFDDFASYFMDFIQKGKDKGQEALTAAGDSFEKVKMSNSI